MNTGPRLTFHEPGSSVSRPVNKENCARTSNSTVNTVDYRYSESLKMARENFGQLELPCNSQFSYCTGTVRPRSTLYTCTDNRYGNASRSDLGGRSDPVEMHTHSHVKLPNAAQSVQVMHARGSSLSYHGKAYPTGATPDARAIHSDTTPCPYPALQPRTRAHSPHSSKSQLHLST